MAYSAILIPHLEAEDAELHATREQTSWIGKQLVSRRVDNDDTRNSDD